MSSHNNHDFKTTLKESIMILVFEGLGTMFLTCLFTSILNNGDFVGMLTGFFVLLIFSARISGSHYNPAVTLAFMLRKDTGRFSRVLGLLYILFQVLGAFLGALLMYTVFQDNAMNITVTMNSKVFYSAMIMSTLGTMLLVFLYLTQTEEKTKLSNDPAITTLIIAAAYVASLMISNSSSKSLSPLNPAIAVGILSQSFFAHGAKEMYFSWIFFTFPFVGALISVLLFEKVYKPSLHAVEHAEGTCDDEDDAPVIDQAEPLVASDGQARDSLF